MNNLTNKIYQYFLLLSLLIFSSFLKALELDNVVQESVSETISQVKNIDLGEAESDLALGIDQAMGKMGEGMEFALEALENGDATTALATMEMLEATMDMAIDEIPKEEFLDFSKLKLDDFSPEELAAAQSMMGDMMSQSMGSMTDMMENMSHVEGAGFDMSGFMGTMDKSGFGFETMFTDNMESMGAMFGEDMSMMGMMDGMDMSSEMMSVFTMDPGSMDMGQMMENMGEMEDMSSMMSEHMDFGNFADMTNMMDVSQMEMMTEGMKEMMSKGSFDSFAENMTAMGAMIKGEGPEGVEEEGQEGFFAPTDQDANMMEMMDTEMDHMGAAFNEMSEDQMGSFMKDMGEEGAMMNLGDMAGMGMDMGDMAGMAMDMNMDMGDMGMGDMGMGGMDMGGMDMGGMDMGGMDMGGMDMGGMDMGGMGMGDVMNDMDDTMKEAFGDSSGKGGMFTEKGGDFGGEMQNQDRPEPPPQ